MSSSIEPFVEVVQYRDLVEGGEQRWLVAWEDPKAPVSECCKAGYTTRDEAEHEASRKRTELREEAR